MMTWAKSTPLGSYLYDLVRTGKTKTEEWKTWIQIFGLEKIEAMIEREKQERAKRMPPTHVARSHADPF